jgi:hypothetical protein
MMFAELPDGFTFGKGEYAYRGGKTRRVGVDYRKRRAFDMLKVVANGRERYFARSESDNWRFLSEDWQEFPSVREMVLVMCTKHRMGVE